MPRYRATADGFMFGRMYGPDLKRSVVHTDKALKKVPSWLEKIAEETAAQKESREAAETKVTKADAEKQEQDKVDVDAVTFTEPSPGAKVETL